MWFNYPYCENSGEKDFCGFTWMEDGSNISLQTSYTDTITDEIIITVYADMIVAKY